MAEIWHRRVVAATGHMARVKAPKGQGLLIVHGSQMRRGPRDKPFNLDLSPVCTENLILIDYVTESPNVSSDDRAALLLPDPVRLAVQVEEPT
jgi:hypothetical protein